MKTEDKAVVQQALEALKDVDGIDTETECVTIDVGESIPALRQLLEQPEPVQSVAQDAERYGARLNDASWAAIEAWSKNEAMGPVPGAVFNNIKGVVRAAILKYLEGYTTPPAQPADHGDELTIAYLDGVHTGKRLVKRVPLTDEQIDLLINGRGDVDDDDYVEPTGDGFGLTDKDLVKLIRRVEKHHGIEGTP